MSRQLDKKIKQSRRLLAKIDADYSAEMEKLRKNKNATSDDIGMLSADWSGDREIEEYRLDQLLTGKLRRRADELDVPLPEYPVYRKELTDWDHNDHWYRNPMDGGFVLTQRGREYLDEAIWRKEERSYNRRVRGISLVIGLVGALTGFVSVTSTHWDKFVGVVKIVWSHLH